MLEGHFGCDTRPGIVNKDFPEEVEEELVERGIRRDNVLLLVRLS